MRKMYSEEQVRAIAQTAVVNALAAIGVEPNEYDGIDVEGLLTAGDTVVDALVVGGSSADFSEHGAAVIKGGLTVEGSTDLGWDANETMGNFMASTGAVRIGGLMEGVSAVFTSDGIRFDADPASNQYIIIGAIPTQDPEIPGALYVDELTHNLKISELK